MNTEQLLSLFELSPATQQQPTSSTAAPAHNHAAFTADGAYALGAAEPTAGSKRRAGGGGGGGLRSVLDGVGELWDEGQYEEQFNLERFLADIR